MHKYDMPVSLAVPGDRDFLQRTSAAHLLRAEKAFELPGSHESAGAKISASTQGQLAEIHAAKQVLHTHSA